MNIIAWFAARSLLARIATVAVVALAAWGGYALWKKSIYNQGYNSALADVEAANKELNDATREAVNAVRACRDAGGVWNQTTGQCDRDL